MVEKIYLKDESAFVRYNEIWNKMKKILTIKFNSQSIYAKKYIKTKVKTFHSVINSVSSDNKTPK